MAAFRASVNGRLVHWVIRKNTLTDNLDLIDFMGDLMIMSENISQLFDRDGYVVMPSLVTETQLEPLHGVLERIVQQRADQLYRDGLSQDVCTDAAFEARWHRIVQQCAVSVEHNIWHELVFGRDIYDLIVQPAILDVIEDIIGPDITVNGDYWIRPMMPQDQVNKLPWHQDSWYYEDHPTGPRDILTVWIPLVDVDRNNGCLEVMPGSHGWGLIDTHVPEGKQWKEPVIARKEKGVQQPLPMKRGDALIFSNLFYHRSLPNLSNLIRWSIDLRYSPTGLPLPRLNREFPGFIARNKRQPDSVEPFTVWQDRVMAARQPEIEKN